MGIKHLWAILTPFCERKPLYELQRKTVAIDLSCWICEAQNIAEYQVQPRMYLRLGTQLNYVYSVTLNYSIGIYTSERATCYSWK